VLAVVARRSGSKWLSKPSQPFSRTIPPGLTRETSCSNMEHSWQIVPASTKHDKCTPSLAGHCHETQSNNAIVRYLPVAFFLWRWLTGGSKSETRPAHTIPYSMHQTLYGAIPALYGAIPALYGAIRLCMYGFEETETAPVQGLWVQ
jgi:hypothetical protein